MTGKGVVAKMNGHTGQVIAGIVSLSIVGSVTVLGYHGTLDGAAVVGLLGAIGGAGVGGFASAHAAKATMESVAVPGGKRATDPPASD